MHDTRSFDQEHELEQERQDRYAVQDERDNLAHQVRQLTAQRDLMFKTLNSIAQMDEWCGGTFLVQEQADGARRAAKVIVDWAATGYDEDWIQP